MTPFLIAIGVILALYLVTLFGIGWFCLHPMRIPLFLSASALGLNQETAIFKSEDGVDLRGWWIAPENPKMVCILSHGYIMNRAECIPMAKKLYENGVACLVYDFRAHGHSGGKASTIGYLERLDVLAAIKIAKEKYPDLPLMGYGSSMGGAATAFAAADGIDQGEKYFDALVLDSTYRQLRHANEGWWKTFFPAKIEPFFRPVWLICWMISKKDPRLVNVDEALSKLENVPILLMHGAIDIIVPLDQAELNSKANPMAKLVVFEGCQHSQARYLQTQKYDEILFDFILESMGIAIK